jgi:hypothetical protein
LASLPERATERNRSRTAPAHEPADLLLASDEFKFKNLGRPTSPYRGQLSMGLLSYTAVLAERQHRRQLQNGEWDDTFWKGMLPGAHANLSR